MSRRTIGQVFALTLAAGLLLSGFIYLLFPTLRIDMAIARLLEPQGLTLSPPVRKTFLPGLVWDNLLLSSNQGALVSSDRLQLRPSLVSIFLGRVAIAGTADIGKGRIKFEYAFNGSNALDFEAVGVNLSDIPFFKSVLGGKSSGVFRGGGKLLRGTKGVNGEIKLEIRQLEYSGVTLGRIRLPDAGGMKTQGLISFSDGKARLESLTLDGEGLYMRMSGNLPSGANAGAAPLNLILEIMPKAEFMEKQKLVFMLLARFMASPGVYKMPIKGTLLKPEIL